jgi:predicted DNA binding CopG/RHH family protein
MSGQVKKTLLTDPSQVPPNLSEEEEAEFWQTHVLTKEYFRKLKPTPRDKLPAWRSKQISMRLPVRNLQRAKALAESRGTRYQTLLNELIDKQLDQEESKEEREATLSQQLLERVDLLLKRVDRLETRVLERVAQLETQVLKADRAAAASRLAQRIQKKQEDVFERSKMPWTRHIGTRVGQTLGPMLFNWRYGLPLPSEDFPGEASVTESNVLKEEMSEQEAAYQWDKLSGAH